MDRSKVPLLLAPSPPNPEDGIDTVVASIDAMKDLAQEAGMGFHVFAHFHLRGGYLLKHLYGRTFSVELILSIFLNSFSLQIGNQIQ